MESVNVLVTGLTRPVEKEYLQQINAVSPKVKARDVSDLARAERTGDSSAEKQFDALLAEAEVIFGFPPPKNLIARAPKLKLIQTPLAGADHYLIPDIIESPVILTKAIGIHGTQASELVFELMLMCAKQAQFCFRQKQEKQWQPFVPLLLRSKTVGIVGLGNIGTEVARLAKAFGMRVVAVRARPKVRSRYVDLVLPTKQIRELLSQSDFVVLALPFTPETAKLIGEAELRAMRPTAYLINIARGNIVDEEALVRALSESWIAGAGLDVFTTEPLPASSKLWDLANVIITPHISGVREDYNIVATRLFCENLGRYLGGKKLLYVVDKKRGY